MFRSLRRTLACTLAFAAVSFVAPAALAEDAGALVRMLDRPGQAEELRGVHTRAIAFYQDAGERVELTVLLSGGALGGEILKTRVALADGQSHEFRMPSGSDDAPGERFVFKRIGKRIDMNFAPTQPTDADAVSSLPEPGAQR